MDTIKNIQDHRFQVIDIIKGIAIILVIILHVDPARKSSLQYIYTATVRQAVPLFFITIGFLSAISCQKKFSISKYLKNKYIRLYLPMHSVAFISVFLHYIFLNKNIVYLAPYWLIGYMKGFSWGGYFFTCYVEWILIFPSIYFMTKKTSLFPLLFVVFSYALHLVFYLNKGFILDITNNNIWMFKSIVITYLPHISLGFLYGNFVINKPNKNIRALTFVTSSILIVLLCKHNFIWSRMGWGDGQLFNMAKIAQLDLSILYAFFLFVFLYCILSRAPRAFNLPLNVLGKYSYEIFLVQAVFFQIIKGKNTTFFLDDLRGLIFSLMAIFLFSFMAICYYEKVRRWINSLEIQASLKL